MCRHWKKPPTWIIRFAVVVPMIVGDNLRQKTAEALGRWNWQSLLKYLKKVYKIFRFDATDIHSSPRPCPKELSNACVTPDSDANVVQRDSHAFPFDTSFGIKRIMVQVFRTLRLAASWYFNIKFRREHQYSERISKHWPRWSCQELFCIGTVRRYMTSTTPSHRYYVTGALKNVKTANRVFI